MAYAGCLLVFLQWGPSLLRLHFFVKGEKSGQMPHAAYILLAVTFVIYIVMKKTVLGRKLTVIGTLGGALATTLILNFVVLFGLQIQHQFIFKGLILLFVTLVSSFANSIAFRSSKN